MRAAYSKVPELTLQTPEVLRVLPPKILNTAQLQEKSALIANGTHPLSAEFCARREICDPPSFLKPSLDELPFPLKLPGVSEGCKIVMKHRKNAERPKAFIAADFDVDGITSAAIVYSALSTLGFDVTTKTPCRQREGYGFNKRLLDEAVQSGAKLLFLLDFGTQQKELIEAAKKRGLDVIVIDHHLCAADERASPDALINPRGMYSGCTFMSAGGLSYMFCLGLSEVLPNVAFKEEEWLGLAVVSTVADVVPLVEENRALVRHGLQFLAENEGLQTLSKKLNLSGEITPSDVAFRLAPTMNAPGRIVEKGGDLVLDLLTSKTALTVAGEEAADLLIACNSARKKREKIDLALAENIIARTGLKRAICVADDRFDPGLAGLVAARLAERYHRPAAVIALCERLGGRASVRSGPIFNTHLALERCAQFLLRFGGHHAAGGFTITTDNVPAFINAFNAEAQAQLGDFVPHEVVSDFTTSAEELSLNADKLLNGLSACEPFGSAHPAPIWFVPQVKLRKVHEIAHHHLLLEFGDNDGRFGAYLFNNPRHPIKGMYGKSLDIGVKLSRARLSNEGGRSAPMIEFCGIR